MTQTVRLTEALKRVMKSRQITYQKLARQLALSEASVKRLFAQHTFTVQRLEAICKILDLDFLQLAKLASEGADPLPSVLTEEQEREFAQDLKLLTAFYRFLQAPEARDHETRYLLKLDRLRLIHLDTKGRAKLMVSRQVRWIPQGPLIQTYGKDLIQSFFDGPFEGELRFVRFVPARLSEDSMNRMKKKLLGVMRELEELQQFDDEVGAKEKIDAGVLVAVRPWDSVAFLDAKTR